jgi:hypothetical protein
MNGERLGLASGTGLRSRTFVSADGATAAVQDGNVPKHLHVNANEMQYILEGTGTPPGGPSQGNFAVRLRHQRDGHRFQ